MGAQCLHAGADEVSRERQARAARLESLRMQRAVLEHAREIRLEQRGDVRRIREAAGHVFGHAAAHGGVRDRSVRGRSRGSRRGPRRRRVRSRSHECRNRRGLGLRHMPCDILRGHAAVASRAIDIARVERMFVQQPANRRAQGIAGGRSGRRGLANRSGDRGGFRAGLDVPRY